MKILIIDRDDLTTNMLSKKLEAQGHDAKGLSSKNDALDLLAEESFEVILIDPTPLTSAQPVILNIRRQAANYPYILLMGQDLSAEEAMKSGANDLLNKPVDGQVLKGKIAQAENLIDLVGRLGDDSEDFPSAGGVIAKSAFNQLFLSALERADRYGEKSCLLFISIDNFDDIMKIDGPYAAEYASAKLSQYLVRLRRQSDIIGQVAKYMYALLMQRPVYESEPLEAASRFAEALNSYHDITSSGATSVILGVRLVEIPSGLILAHHEINYESS